MFLFTGISISSLFLIPSLCLSCSTINQKNSEDYVDDNYDVEHESNLFFPELYIEDYFDYIEFDENANPYIGDKFIKKVIYDVVSRVSSSQGQIKFTVTKYSNTLVDFDFIWIYNNKTLSKTYSFEINM